MTEWRASVRQVVEFSLHERDLSPAAFAAKRMREGAAAHKARQSAGAREETAYQAEKSLSADYAAREITLRVTGRADGLLLAADGAHIVEEIKLGTAENPLVPAHRAQAAMYGHMLCQKEGLTGVRLRILYVDENGAPVRLYEEEADSARLKGEFEALCAAYCAWAERLLARRRARDASLFGLAFPYGAYRAGQRTFAANVYVAIRERKRLFAQAPTGIGKTMAALYPAALALGEGKCARVLMLTARTTGRKSAMDALAILRAHGARLLAVEIAAKDKVCPMEKRDCRPEVCPYAKGFYDRLPDALAEALTGGDWGRGQLDALARKHALCPFELALSLAQEADVVVCDYNYVFDPNVYLKRFFQEGIKGDYIFLIDEAHNMVERSRQMYSAQIYKEDFLTVKRIMKEHSRSIEKALEKCNKILLGMKRECENYTVYDTLGNMVFSFMRLMTLLDEFLQKANEFPGKKDVMDFYFELRNFLNIYDLVDEHYVMYSELEADGRFMLKLFCVDPSLNIQKRLDKGKSAVFFSATFLPVNYYKSLLSTKKDNYAIYADSTFDSKKRLLAMATDVSTRYTRRSRSEYERIAGYINAVVTQKTGNYMVFFPSYKMMNDVADIYCEKYADETELMLQKNNMSEAEREEFLDRFSEESDRTLVAFGIMGGIFGEGIDLKNDRLIGAIVVGTGLPQISNERTILKDYYDAENGCGFDYAFRYPGINKVLQAAGRVIRTTEDTGVILLLDERFWQREYDLLYPREWSDRKPCNIANVGKLVADFWEQI